MSKLALIIKTKTQPGQRDAVRALYEQMLAPRATANDAQQLVVFSYDAQDANVFYLFEIYSGQEAFQAASQAPWFWEYMSAAAPLLDGQPEVTMATPMWAKGATV
jgi:quinol monooxygenase YgiN